MGLGYTSPQDFTNASGYGQFVIGPTDGNGNVTGMTIYSTLTNGIMFADATSGPGAYAGYLLYTHASDKLEIATSSTPRLTLDSNGSTFSTSNVTITNGNLVMGTSGKGIDFSATSNSSGTMTSELLNDYEEGTFTATVVGGTTAGAGTYSRQVGVYTKIGNLVTCHVWIQWSAHTGTGDLYFAGFPFTSIGTTNYRASGVIAYFEDLTLTAGFIPGLVIVPSSTQASVPQNPVGGGAIGASVQIDTAANIHFSITYQTA